jgi:16S rRNA (adenine1518-N6/adenine1519-N6)-dimethyltransferase
VSHRPRKRFGQHFLVDEGVIAAIVAAVSAKVGEHVVEIGPGLGAITRPLLQQCGALTVIELDRDLAARLRGVPGLDVVEADVLRVDLAALAAARAGAKLRIVGNLPYNISTPLLFQFLRHAGAIRDLTLMLQREVAVRLAAPPGGRDYGRLAVMLAPAVAAERLFDVGPGAFQPPPRVWSAVVRLTVRAPPLFVVSPHYAPLVAAAFSRRRKTLRNALGELMSREDISACGIDPGVRPERLAPQDFNTLAQALDRAGAGR